MQRRQFLTAALSAPAALAGSSALATSEIPKLADGGAGDSPRYERHAVLIVMPQGPWKPANADDESCIIDEAGIVIGFYTFAAADRYRREWNECSLREQGKSWAIPFTVRFSRQQNVFEDTVVVILSREPRQDRVVETLGPVSSETSLSFCINFEDADDRYVHSVAVGIDSPEEELGEVGDRRFEVVITGFDRDGNPRACRDVDPFATEDQDEAIERAQHFNYAELVRPTGRWAVVRVIDAASKGGA